LKYCSPIVEVSPSFLILTFELRMLSRYHIYDHQISM
jgi:hypothetical protein